MTKAKYYVRAAQSNQKSLDDGGWDVQNFHGEIVDSFQSREEASEAARRFVADDDGFDSEGYPINQPRIWSADELKDLRRRERACDNYG